MYLKGTETNPVGTPDRVTWMARASVPVTEGSASIWYGMPSASAAATKRSNTIGLMFGPRAMTGPSPQTIFPCLPLSMPG